MSELVYFNSLMVYPEPYPIREQLSTNIDDLYPFLIDTSDINKEGDKVKIKDNENYHKNVLIVLTYYLQLLLIKDFDYNQVSVNDLDEVLTNISKFKSRYNYFLNNTITIEIFEFLLSKLNEKLDDQNIRDYTTKYAEIISAASSFYLSSIKRALQNNPNIFNNFVIVQNINDLLGCLQEYDEINDNIV